VRDYQEPIIERYQDALNRVRDLEIRAENDPNVRLVTVISEIRAIRDDILAERRDSVRQNEAIHRRMDEIESKKVDHNPNAAKAFWIALTAVVAGFVGLITWLIEGSIAK
jgi:hypothetical protein